MYCRSCGSYIDGIPELCKHCGARPLGGSAFCNACRSKTDLLDETCKTCGAKLVTYDELVTKDRENHWGVFVPIFIAAGFYTLLTITSSQNSFILRSTSLAIWGLLFLLWMAVGCAWKWHLAGGMVLLVLNVLPSIVLSSGLVTIYDPMGAPSAMLFFACLFLYNGPLTTSAIILVVKGWKEF